MIQHNNPSEDRNGQHSPFVVFFNLIHEIDDNEIFDEIRTHICFNNNACFFQSVRDFLTRHGKTISWCDASEMAEQICEQKCSYVDCYKKAEQSIQLTINRPAFLIRNDQIDNSIQTHWKKRLDVYQKNVLKVIPSVGRIEVLGHPQSNWVGTGWLLHGTDIIVTNRHVANNFASKGNGGYRFNLDPYGNPVQVRIDFKEEYKVEEACEFDIDKVLHINDMHQPDIALLRVKKKNRQGNLLPEGLELSDYSNRPSEKVFVIGYPATNSTKKVRSHGFEFKGISDVKRLAPGEMFPSGAASYLCMHDCTTCKGNSGSPVINLKTGKVMAVHYGSSEYKYKGVHTNWAVDSSYIKKLLKKLRVLR